MRIPKPIKAKESKERIAAADEALRGEIGFFKAKSTEWVKTFLLLSMLSALKILVTGLLTEFPQGNMG